MALFPGTRRRFRGPFTPSSRLYPNVRQIPVPPPAARQAVSCQILRCARETKVIGFNIYPTFRRLVEQDRQAQGPGSAFMQVLEQEVLSQSGLNHRLPSPHTTGL